MAGERYVFIPWPRKEGGQEGIDAAIEWNTHALGKSLNVGQGKSLVSDWESLAEDKYKIVCQGDAVVSRTTWSADDQIYVKGGHCSPGSRTMQNYSRNAKQNLDAEDVAGRLISQFSLGNSFVGKVKLYTCDSAVAGGLYNFSFADIFKQKFVKTCPSCTIYGYKASVSKRHIFEPTKGEFHKGGDPGSGKYDKTAKEYRWIIYPNPGKG